MKSLSICQKVTGFFKLTFAVRIFDESVHEILKFVRKVFNGVTSIGPHFFQIQLFTLFKIIYIPMAKILIILLNINDCIDSILKLKKMLLDFSYLANVGFFFCFLALYWDMAPINLIPSGLLCNARGWIFPFEITMPFELESKSYGIFSDYHKLKNNVFTLLLANIDQ